MPGTVPKKKKDLSDAKKRKCMSCKNMFYSLWRGNRICDRCKTHDAWQNQDYEEGYNISND